MKIKTFFNTIEEIAFEYSIVAGIDFIKEYYYQRKENVANIGGLFTKLFPSISVDFFLKLNEASNYYFYSILAVDKIIDENKTIENKEALLLAFLLREKSLHIMYQLFEPTNIYWEYFKKYYKEYIASVSTEIRDGLNDKRDISIEEMESVYLGKAALLKASIIAMAVKDGNIGIIKKIEQTIDYYQIALALMDDINDWKQDWSNNQFNYLLNKVLINNKLQKSSITDSKILGKYIFFNGEATHILNLAITYHKKAYDVINGLDIPLWKSNILSEEKKCKILIADIEIIVNKELIKVGEKSKNKKDLKLPKLKLSYVYCNPSNHKLIKHALSYIIKQWQVGFVEAEVYNYFPEKDGFSLKKRFYSGDVFQRAVILDILYDINPNMAGSLFPFLQNESEYLVGKMHRNNWWNFYHDLEYQPCDADTTAQVIQVLLKMDSFGSISHKCEKSIDDFLKWHTNNEGGIGTWYLPPLEKCNKQQLKQRAFYKDYINLNIDFTKDIEVMANLLFALFKINPKKYDVNIKKGIEYIEKMQLESGCWTSSWYWGNLYGVYVCLKLLTEVKPNSLAIIKASVYIIRTQNQDGGWGWATNQSDPLNTSYALISKKYLSCSDNESINNGLNYIYRSVYENEALAKCNYINFQKKNHSVFKSNSITMAYVLKAVTSWNY